MAGPSSSTSMSRQSRDALVPRVSIHRAGRLLIWLGLQTVPPGDPFPKEHWNKRMCVLLVAHNGKTGGRPRSMPSVRHCRGLLSTGPARFPTPRCRACLMPSIRRVAVVLEGGLRTVAARCSYRRPYRARGKGTKPDLRDASLSDRRGRPPQVSGDTAWGCRDATWSMVIVGVDPDPGRAMAMKEWATELLGGSAPLRPCRRLPQFHDGRRRRGACEGQLRQQLPVSLH